MIRRALVVFVAALVALAAAVVDARAVSIPATVNGTVAELGGAPFGSPDPTFVQIFSSPGFESRGILEFNISGLVAPVSSAEILLTRHSGGGAPVTFSVFGYVGNGALESADFNAGTTNVATVNYNTEPTLSIDATSFVNGLIGSATFAGFTIASDQVFGLRFNQTNDSEIPLPPASLEVEAATPAVVPEPSTVLLLSSSLAAMAGYSCRRRKTHESSAV